METWVGIVLVSFLGRHTLEDVYVRVIKLTFCVIRAALGPKIGDCPFPGSALCMADQLTMRHTAQ